ncbi:coiled-coil domain-containing protein 62 isoform 2-T2 [Leptosomus discolor]
MPGSAPVPPSPRSSSLLHSASPQKLSPSLGNSTIQQQRQELQLLFAELRDCEKEHNDRVAVHQGQRLAWEDDRQKVLTLGERYNLLNDELNKRNEIIKSLVLTQQVFKEMSRKVTYKTLYCQALEEKNQSLLYSVLELSAKTGQLQVREQELLTMLKLKDEVILETTDDITEFKLKFKELESALREAKMEELSLNKANQDLQLRLKELVLETNKLKAQRLLDSNSSLISVKEAASYLPLLQFNKVEKAKLKDQLLQFAKSKQARTDAELSSLRQIYVKQQRDLQFLHVSLGSSQELRQKHEKAAHERSTGMAFSAPESNSETDTVRTQGTHGIREDCGTAQVPKSRVKTTSEMCGVDNGLLLNASALEETTSAYLNPHQKVVKVLAVLTEEEKPDVASSSNELGSRVFCEAISTKPLRNREISENRVESRDQQTFESSLPECEHWFNTGSCVDLQSTLAQNTTMSDKTDTENKTWEERTGRLFDQTSREIPAAIHRSESDSCSNNFIVKEDAWRKPISDPEWLEIFKPIKRHERIWHGKGCSCLKTSQEMKCASSKSEENVDLSLFHLHSPCLTSTQKGDRSQRCEEFSDEDFPLESNDLSVTKPTNRCCNATTDQDTVSPTSTLQCALAESRQMVADLELSALLHASPRCSPHSIHVNTKFPTEN